LPFFKECIQRLSIYTSQYGWKCNINSWKKKGVNKHVWVIVLSKGVVVVYANGSSLKEAAEKMLDLIEITEKIACTVE
jgi:hypothetical protein